MSAGKRQFRRNARYIPNDDRPMKWPDALHTARDTHVVCDHDWPTKDGQTDMEGSCTKCGRSFTAYVHQDCI